MNKNDEIEEFNRAKEFPQFCVENGKFEGFGVVIANPPYMNQRDLKPESDGVLVSWGDKESCFRI